MPLPSPNQLKRKILIKNKRLRPEVEKVELEAFWKGELTIDDATEEKEDASAPVINTPAATTSNESSAGGGGGGAGGATPTNASTTSSSASATASASAAAAASALNSSNSNAAATAGSVVPTNVTHTTYQGSTLNVHPYLSSMVVYTQPMKFQGFEFSDQENMSFKMSSFPETTALGYLKTQAIEFVNYNKRQMSRIYPKGSRVDSSNFMPQVRTIYNYCTVQLRTLGACLTNCHFRSFGTLVASWCR